MAVAADGEAILSGRQASADPWTFSGKTTAGTNRIGVLRFFSGGGAPAVAPTWGGSNMTLIGSVAKGAGAVYAYYIVAPATASSDIVVDLTAPAIGAYVVTSYTGAHQSTAPTGFASATGSSTTPSVDVTSVTDDLVLDAMDVDNVITSVGAGQTAEYLDTTGPSDRFGGSYEAGAATVTMSWTVSSAAWCTLGFSLVAAAGGASADPPRLHRGQAVQRASYW